MDNEKILVLNEKKKLSFIFKNKKIKEIHLNKNIDKE